MITTQTPAPMLETQLASKGYRIPKTEKIIYSRSTIVQLRPLEPLYLTLQSTNIRRYLEYAVHNGGVHLNYVLNRKWRNVIKLNMNADGNSQIKSYFRTNHVSTSYWSLPHKQRFNFEYGMDLLQFMVKSMQESFNTTFESLTVTQHLYAVDQFDTLGNPLIFVKNNVFVASNIYVPYNHGYYCFECNSQENKNVFWAIANKSKVRIAVSLLMPELLLNFGQVGNDMTVIVDPEIRLELCTSMPWVFLPRVLRKTDHGHRYQFEAPYLYRLTRNPNKITNLGYTILTRYLTNREMHALNGNIRIFLFLLSILCQYMWFLATKTMNKLTHSLNGNSVDVSVNDVVFKTTTFNADINAIWIVKKEPRYPFIVLKDQDKTTLYGFCTSLPQENFESLVGIRYNARPKKFINFINKHSSHCTVKFGHVDFKGQCAFKNEPIYVTVDELDAPRKTLVAPKQPKVETPKTKTLSLIRPSTSCSSSSSIEMREIKKTPSRDGSCEVEESLPLVIRTDRVEEEKQHKAPKIPQLKIDARKLFPNLSPKQISAYLETHSQLDMLRLLSPSMSTISANPERAEERRKLRVGPPADFWKNHFNNSLAELKENALGCAHNLNSVITRVSTSPVNDDVRDQPKPTLNHVDKNNIFKSPRAFAPDSLDFTRTFETIIKKPINPGKPTITPSPKSVVSTPSSPVPSLTPSISSTSTPTVENEPVYASDFALQSRSFASNEHYLRKLYTSFIDKAKIGHKTSPLESINEFLRTAVITDFKKIQTQVDTKDAVICTNKEWMNSLTKVSREVLGIGSFLMLSQKIGNKLPNQAKPWLALTSLAASVAYVGYKHYIQQPSEILRIHRFTDPLPVAGKFNVLPSQLGSETLKSPCLKTICQTFIFRYDLTPCDTITQREIIFSPMLLEEIKRSFNPHITVDNTSSRAGWFTVLSNLVRAWSNKLIYDAPVEAVFSGTVHVAVCQIADDLNMQQDFC